MIDPVVERLAPLFTSGQAKEYADLAVQASKDYHELSATVDISKMEKPKKETETGNFDDYEYLLAAIYAASWERKSAVALQQILDVVDASTIVDLSRVNLAIERAQRTLADLVTSKDEDAMAAVFKASAKRGATVARASAVLDSLPSYPGLLRGMIKSSKYYTNAYFNEQVVPYFYKTFEKAIETGLAPTDEGFKAVRAALDERLLGRVPYWHTVSNAAASRSYHWGLIKTGMVQGYRGYKLVAVLDKRTSAICQKLHNKEFWLADAEQVYDRVANSSEGEAKDVHPWITGDEAKGLTQNDVYSRAVYVPPFHGRCRTTMQLL